MSEKVRRVDFYPVDWTDGISGLDLGAAAVGVYWQLCALCYSTGRASLPEAETIRRLAKILGDDPRTIRAAMARLVAAGKVTRTEGESVASGGRDAAEIEPRRVRDELERAVSRVRMARENGENGGRPRKKIKDITKPDGLFREKLATSNQQPATSKAQPAEPKPVTQPVPEAAPRSPSSDRQFEERVIDAAKIDPARWAGNFGMIPTWRNQGATDADIIAGIEACAARKSYRPPASLRYFSAAIDEARRMRIEAQAAGRDPPRTEAAKASTLEQRVAEYRIAKEAAKARGVMPGQRGFPPASDYGIHWHVASAGWVLIDGWNPAARSGAAA